MLSEKGGNPMRITESIARATSPSWSADGERIACYGTDEQEAGFGETLARVWTVAAAGGVPERLMMEYDRSVMMQRQPHLTPGPVWSQIGKAPVEFVRYPGSSHLFTSSGRPSRRVDYNRRVVEWLEHYTHSNSCAPTRICRNMAS
jgi:dipeptidyl aminopeptidase/acylaminoacyl peptidase